MALLEIRDLKKTYRSPDGSEQLILDVPAFSLEAEQQVALEGSSGSGKTTLLNVVAGILEPDSGEVLLDGRDMADLGEEGRDAHRGRCLGYVFQTFNLLQGYTALENVLLGMMFGSGTDRNRAQDLLERLQLKDRLHHRPSQLSVGEQQRVAVARALGNHPRLVLADEPTGNLDARHAREACALLREVCAEQGAALLLVSHDPRILGSFDSCVRLQDINRALATEGTTP